MYQTRPKTLDDRGVVVPLLGHRGEAVIRVEVCRTEDDHHRGQAGEHERPRAHGPERPATGRRGRLAAAVGPRGRENAVAQQWSRSDRGNGVGQGGDDVRKRGRFDPTRLANGEVRGDRLGRPFVQGAEREGLEIVEDVIGHRVRSKARRIF
jgi:hypothetical protein